MATNTIIPKYQGGYSIEYRRSDDLYHCLQDGGEMAKKTGKPATYKSLKLASDFMDSYAQRAIEPAKSTRWTPPTPMVIASIEEQLAALSSDETRRFVVCEAPYGIYHQLGYITVDRSTGKQYRHYGSKHHAWNNVYEQRSSAEEDALYLNANPPVEEEKIEDLIGAKIMAEIETAWENRFQTPLPEPAQPELPHQIVIASEETVGTIIEYRGQQWLVTSCVYTSSQDAADLEDAFDIFLDAGWHSWLRKLDTQVAEVLKEQIKAGSAKIVGGCVEFEDELDLIPLSDIAYDEELGLYQKSKFPQGVGMHHA